MAIRRQTKKHPRPKEAFGQHAKGAAADDLDHPLSDWLRHYIKTQPNGNQQLAADLAIAPSHVWRLLHLKSLDRPSLGLLKRLFGLLGKGSSCGTLPTSFKADSQWDSFVQERPHFQFVELAKAVACRPDMSNPAGWLLTPQDELAWELEAHPKQRWLLTDVLAEAMYDEIFERTCALLKTEDFKRLVVLMSRARLTDHPLHEVQSQRLMLSPDSHFAKFHRLAISSGRLGDRESAEKMFAEKVRCIAVPPGSPLIVRLRLDDLSRPSPYTSGVAVLGSASEPLILRLPDHSLEAIRDWLVPVVNELEHMHRNGDVTGASVPRTPSGFELVFPTQSKVS